MYLKQSRGLTLVESLVSIFLLSALVISILGAFFISRLSAMRAHHRMIAMSLVKEYMEKEIASGWNQGTYQTFASEAPVTRAIEGVTYTITPDPIISPNEAPLGLDGTAQYKTIGFRVTWTEAYASGGGVALNERAVTYIALH